MKKFYFSLVVALLFSIPTLANNVIVKGYIKDSNGNAIANHSVYIATDSISTPSGCHQHNYVQTNANGFYIDTLRCNTGNITKINITVYDCNGTTHIENIQLTSPVTVVERNFILSCTVQQSCNADFVFNIGSGGNVFFSSTSSSSSTINAHQWNFGDGTTGSGNTAWHNYSAGGTYSVKLKITASNGCKDSIAKIVTIIDSSNCNPQFSASIITSNKLIFNSNASATAIGDSIIQRIWTFGDGTGNNGNNKIVDHIYQQSGTYNVCLKIISAQGCIDSICKIVTAVVPNACVSNFSFQRLFATTPGYNVVFNSTASAGTTPNDSIISRLWTFGDGQQLSGNNVSPTHMYTSQGSYSVCLKITTASGCQKTECKVISIIDSTNCHANFNYNIANNGTVTFVNTSSTMGSSTQYLWTFGNGSVSTVINPIHTFLPGTYTVRLKIITGSCIDSVAKTIVIPPPGNCEAVFQFTGLAATPGSNGYKIQFASANSHGVSSTDSIISRTWIFGDGTTTTGNVLSPIHIYTSPAVYTVCLVIKTISNCIDTVCKTITVPMQNQLTCQSKFTYEHLPATSNTGRSIRFNSTTSFAGFGDSIISRKWTFGDGTSITSGNIVSPVHVYQQPGTYNVCLTITTALGCSKTECKIVVVPQVAGNCIPHFTWAKTASKQITFNSVSSWVAINDTIIERKWVFGDASPVLGGNVIAPVKNYQYNGIYTVALKIRTVNNCEKTFYGVVNVQDSVATNVVERIKIVSLNPTPATFQMQAVVWSLQNNIQAELAVYDIYGTKKWSINKVLFAGNNITVVPTGFLPPGPYFFRVTTIFGVRSRPFLKY
jgi:PKD repeat protein